ncbi:PiggyBac transposable element-derived protein 4 [Plakobranchus ocellatus]|uniref:PiggyBac transposable element-derived protein 4 n=1 Tax=Plakobranchus ocellatus TaxID=259542 RepID=A0AAV3ZM62_9GAST|nr:PiggyBac transposable element-derived protein 4 [Plakobranchus ocellatus]
MKLINRGYKLWTRADTGGYVSKFEVYKEKMDWMMAKPGLCENVVMRMCENLKAKWHEVYFDNFFTSLSLLQHLYESGVYSCGTTCTNRKGMPDFFLGKSLERSNSDFRVAGDYFIVVVKWMDNKSVHVASNFHDTGLK